MVIIAILGIILVWIYVVFGLIPALLFFLASLLIIRYVLTDSFEVNNVYVD